ncbi:MAG: Hsp20/alpha crystallin family protein [Patescibacteria group bacterium]
MPQEPRSFFERLTGAKVLHSPEVVDLEETLEVHHPLEQEEYGEEALQEALEEPEVDTEEDFSDEDDEESEEQEGQLTVDVFQDDENIIIQSTVAGVSPDDLDVSITNDMVVIRGERRSQHTVDPEDFFYQECYWGTFSRSIILPVEIDADNAEAKIKNGVLTVRIPKANAAVTRKLKVKAI